jgi:hypothetical protein
MIECLECGKWISESANPCPRCGEPEAGQKAVEEKRRRELAYWNWKTDPERIAAEEQEQAKRAAADAKKDTRSFVGFILIWLTSVALILWLTRDEMTVGLVSVVLFATFIIVGLIYTTIIDEFNLH